MWEGIICITLGSVFGFFGLFLCIQSYQLINYGICTTAVISRIEKKYRNAGRGHTFECYYTFTHNDGTLYEIKGHTYRITDHVGKETELYYDAKNPQKKFHIKSDTFGNFFATLIGFGLLIAGIHFLTS